MAPEEILDALTSISNTSNRLSLLCKNILNWIQYEKNELELSNQKFELNEVVDQMIQIISIATTQKGNTIIKSMPAKKIINTNLDALGIVILNLLNNANRFSNHSRIFVTCDEDIQNRLVIKIKDEGVGMTEEIREILLQSGSPKTQPDTDYQKSSGIGYYIIHEILKSVNGTIQISKPEIQTGTEITITWPLQ
jgi:two-component system phosphate regulon sensor histidine kinase PhoR